MRESGDRIRRERASPTSPRLILRRVLVLSEGRQYREAAQVLQKLGPNTIAAVAGELPLDLLVEGLPHSAQLLETLFNKLILASQKPNVYPDQVVWQLVRLFASHEDPSLKTKVARLAKALVEYQPEIQNEVAAKKKALEQAVQGLGCHGLTPDVSGLTHLHVALKNELQRHVEAYKSALHRLDELGVTSTDTKKPVDASHQRLLSLRLPEIQQRLIDNKTLLTILDKPALKQLSSLVETLATRVQNDKEALFCVSQLKRLQPLGDDVPVATILMSFSKGCGSLLDLMKMPGSPCNSDTGYHSETEGEQEVGFPKDTNLRKLWVLATRRDNFKPSNTAVLCENNFGEDDYETNVHGNRVPKKGAVPSIFNFPAHLIKVVEKRKSNKSIKRALEPNQEEIANELCSTEVPSLVELIESDSEIPKGKSKVKVPDNQEINIEILKEIAPSTSGVKIKFVSRVNAFSRYDALYHHSRPRAMEALDSLPDLMHANQLKAKILFSVVVLAFRQCRVLRDHKLYQTCRQLHLDPRSSSTLSLRQEATRCMGAAAENFPLRDAEEQVLSLVCDTLKEYECLEHCTALRKYVGDTVRVAWRLVCHIPEYELDTDFQTPVKLQPEKHQRHHTSNRNNDTVKSYLWPALMLQNNYVYKAVVITDGT